MKSLAARAAELAGAGIPEDGCLSLAFAGLEEMARLNKDFVGHEGPTDVICFDYRQSKSPDGIPFPADEEEPEEACVDIVVCPEVAKREAAKRGLPYAEELTLYIVHGLLHASGEDDLSPKPKRRMRRREREVIAELQNEFMFSDVFPS